MRKLMILSFIAVLGFVSCTKSNLKAPVSSTKEKVSTDDLPKIPLVIIIYQPHD
jgi:hypothetical protein